MTKLTAVLKAPLDEPRVLDVFPPGEAGWLARDEVAALTPESVRERIRALKPMIAEHAAESERLGYPHPKVWEAIRATGFFYHFVPKSYGGCEFGPEDFFLTCRLICEACPSTGWAATFTNEHNWVGSMYPKEAQDQFFAKGRYFIAPLVSTPPGMATKVSGGYKVTARWRFGSGAMHSNWCLGHALLPTASDAPPQMLLLAFPMSEVKVLDTWHVAGLAATGSNDLVVNDLFVPDHMAVSAQDTAMGTTPGTKIHKNPIYRMPFSSFLALVVSVPIIGAARGAVEIFSERLKIRKVTGTQTILSEKTNYQVLLAKADLMVRTAEFLLQKLAREVLERAANNQNTDVPARMASTAQNAYAARLARDAIRLMVDNSGASVHMLSDPLQRLARDANVGCGHLIEDFEQLAEQHGRSLLGLPPITYFY